MKEIQDLPPRSPPVQSGRWKQTLQWGVRNAKASLAHQRVLWILLTLLGEWEGVPEEVVL